MRRFWSFLRWAVVAFSIFVIVAWIADAQVHSAIWVPLVWGIIWIFMIHLESRSKKKYENHRNTEKKLD